MVQLKGNIALVHYSTPEPRELDSPYSCSDAHDASKGRVVYHLRTVLHLLFQILSVVVHSS